MCKVHYLESLNNIQHGDIIIKKNEYMSVVMDYGEDKISINTQKEDQAYNYINIPLKVTKTIKDPLSFYEDQLKAIEGDYYISEIYLCPIVHASLINKYFNWNNNYKYTIAYPYIYKINKQSCYDLDVINLYKRY